LCAAFNGHNLDAMMGHFADDCVLEMPRGPDSLGARLKYKSAVREALACRFQGEPGYYPQHDDDRDGIACEPWPRP
jgi:hypothetical protein